MHADGTDRERAVANPPETAGARDHAGLRMTGALQPYRSTREGPWRAASALIVVAVIVVLVRAGWAGFLETDDLAYATAANSWLHHFPFLADNHWGLRHMIVLPIAAFFALFGENETTLFLVMSVYFVLFLGLIYFCVRDIGGDLAALLAVLLIAATPAFALSPSLLSPDIPEAFFVLGSVWAFRLGWRGNRRWLFLLAGLLASLAFITRETSVALFVLYGVLFLMNYGGDRKAYLWMALGFAPVALTDFIALGLASGDPLYRFHVALRGAAGDGPAQGYAAQATPGLDRFGAIDTPRWAKPLVVLFVNQSFGIVLWAAVPAAIMLSAQSRPSEQRRTVRLFAGLGLTWFLVLGYALAPWLWVIARYLMTGVAALIIPLAITVAALLERRRWLLGATILAAVLAVDAGLVASENVNLMFGERALVAFVRQAQEPVRTDPSTLRSAGWLLSVAGLSDRVTAAPPAPGTIYFFNGKTRRPLPADWPVKQPAADWTLIQRFDAEPKVAALIGRRLGVERLLPAAIARKLDPPSQFAAAYRVPAGP